MGFPVAYYELLLPRTLLHIVFFLGQVRWFISWAFEAAGLGDLLDSSDAPWTETVAAAAAHSQHEHHNRHQQNYLYRFRSVSLTLVGESLPLVRYEELEGGDRGHVGGSCAVCLYEFETDDQVRRLRNCRHVYHRGCLDPWLEHGQRTCPLCRTPLVGGGEEAEAERHDASDPGWGFGVAPPDILEDDFMIDSSFSSLAASTPLQSPTLLLPHQLYPTTPILE